MSKIIRFRNRVLKLFYTSLLEALLPLLSKYLLRLLVIVSIAVLRFCKA
jgi:hypothetical protein